MLVSHWHTRAHVHAHAHPATRKEKRRMRECLVCALEKRTNASALRACLQDRTSTYRQASASSRPGMRFSFFSVLSLPSVPAFTHRKMLPLTPSAESWSLRTSLTKRDKHNGRVGWKSPFFFFLKPHLYANSTCILPKYDIIHKRHHLWKFITASYQKYQHVTRTASQRVDFAY